MNRFDLEDAITKLQQVSDDIDTIIYAIGDSKMKHTEDQLLNMLIGAKQLHDTRYQHTWEVFESLIEDKVITSMNTPTC